MENVNKRPRGNGGRERTQTGELRDIGKRYFNDFPNIDTTLTDRYLKNGKIDEWTYYDRVVNWSWQKKKRKINWDEVGRPYDKTGQEALDELSNQYILFNYINENDLLNLGLSEAYFNNVPGIRQK